MNCQFLFRQPPAQSERHPKLVSRQLRGLRLYTLSLAGSPGSKAMKQVTQQIFTFSLKAIGESALRNCLKKQLVFAFGR
ncbi:hypothetical protein MKW98_019142 [Papaver atlanticum]|uniref:Uncharacterized protein n=1 Tax=Papaver atlanticum TaxID=357466 RepID=A0AAD4XZQ0_9MAGN|nr:hypothetical protein MKW98_019142 [Papaver atlanticum]